MIPRKICPVFLPKNQKGQNKVFEQLRIHIFANIEPCPTDTDECFACPCRVPVLRSVVTSAFGSYFRERKWTKREDLFDRERELLELFRFTDIYPMVIVTLLWFPWRWCYNLHA